MDKANSQTQVGSLLTPCGIADTSRLTEQAECECECSCNAVNPIDSALSMPICFLVREQAKSLIAIQNLQKRLENIEGFQSEVISAVGEVHNYLSQNVREGTLVHSSGSSIKKKSTVIPNTVKQNELQLCRRTLRNIQQDVSCSMPATAKEEHSTWRLNCYEPKNEAEITTKKIFELSKSKDCVSESDKQDSGLDSDCRDHGQETSISQNAVFSPRKNCINLLRDESCDELLELLNEISQKGEALQKHISVIEEKNAELSSQIDEKSKIQYEQEEFHHILNKVRDQVDVRNKLHQSENGQLEIVSARRAYENEEPCLSLVDQYHSGNGFHRSEIDNDDDIACQGNERIAATAYPVQHGTGEITNEKLVHKVNGAKVSLILRENSVLELRKQVLLYLMENEILHSKLFQTEQLLSTKSNDWQKAEAFLNIEVKNLMQENQNLHITLEEQKLEVIALKSKVRMLERVLQAVTVENRELNFQLGEMLGFGEALQNSGQPVKKPSLNVSMSPSELVKPRRSSLPAKLCSQQEISLSCLKSQAHQNSRSSMDVIACNQQCIHEIVDESSAKQNVSLANQVYQQPVFSSSQAHLPSVNQAHPSAKANTLIRHSSASFATSRHNDCLDDLIKRTLNSETAYAKNYETQRKGKEPNSNEHNVKESSLKTSFKRTSSDNICKPLESIKEKPRSSVDVSKFPFYSILEKLKPSTDYKLRKNLRPELTQSESNTPCNQTTKCTPPPHPSSSQKLSEYRYNTNRVKTSSSVESDQSLVEQCKRMYPGFDKNLHKRMQDFLDRITAESDEAMV